MGHSEVRGACITQENAGNASVAKATLDKIAEHISAIETSMKQIAKLPQDKQASVNSIVRWLQNKEKHCDQLRDIVTYNFMSQRVRPVVQTDGKRYKEYITASTLLHEILVFNMRAKMTTDLSNVDKLKALLVEFRAAYFRTATVKD